MRLPLSTTLKTRTGAPEGKDARLNNAYIEIKGEQSLVRKRTAAQGGVPVGSGTAQGGIGFNIGGTDYIIGVWGDTLTNYTGGGTTWAIGTSYSIGDHVSYNFVDYWALNDHSGSTPPSANWSSVYIPAVPNTFSILAGVGLNIAKTSTTGSVWINRTIEVGTWRDVAWSGSLNLFCAIKANGTSSDAATSPDGITWTLRTTPLIVGGFVGIAWSQSLGLFVAVSPNTGTSAIMTSPDGITWTSRTTPSNGYYAVSWSSSLLLFVAVGYIGIITSSDGITWTSRSCPAISYGTYGLTGITYGNGKFVAVAAAGNNQNENLSIYSADGINWSLGGICPWDGSGVVASVAYSSSLDLYSVIHWGNGGTIYAATSADGISWTSRTIVSGNHRKIYWSPSLVKFITNLGYLSNDGITWTGGGNNLYSLSGDEL